MNIRQQVSNINTEREAQAMIKVLKKPGGNRLITTDGTIFGIKQIALAHQIKLIEERGAR